MTAEILFDKQHARSCASRSYYAAFACVHAILLHLNMQAPERGNWSNLSLPALLSDTVRARAAFVPPYMVTLLRNDLVRCWNNRLLADYEPRAFGLEVARNSLAAARRIGHFGGQLLS